MGTEWTRLLTMTEAADILRIRGPRRGEAACKRLRRLAASTGVDVLVDTGGPGWMTTRRLLEQAVPALRSPEVSGRDLSRAVLILQNRVQALENRVAALE